MRDDMVSIYDAGTLDEAHLLTDRLSQADISSYIADDDSPLDGLTAGEQTIRVMVLPDDADRAREVVEAFEKERA